MIVCRLVAYARASRRDTLARPQALADLGALGRCERVGSPKHPPLLAHSCQPGLRSLNQEVALELSHVD